MDYAVVIKGGFVGFAMAMGAQMLVFFLVGRILSVTPKNFVRVFTLGGIVSFALVYLLVHYKIAAGQVANPQLYLSGLIGGWMAGIFAGLTHTKNLLIRMSK